MASLMVVARTSQRAAKDERDLRGVHLVRIVRTAAGHNRIRDQSPPRDFGRNLRIGLASTKIMGARHGQPKIRASPHVGKPQSHEHIRAGHRFQQRSLRVFNESAPCTEGFMSKSAPCRQRPTGSHVDVLGRMPRCNACSAHARAWLAR